MKPYRMKKAEFAEWLKRLDKAMLDMGAEKIVEPKRFEGHEDTPYYHFQTRAGKLTLHPDVCWAVNPRDPQKYHCTVFGRFEDWQAAEKLGHRPKWNHHFGACDALGIGDAIEHLTFRLSGLLPQEVVA